MAARIEQGVLLSIIHDHVLHGITYEDKIERTTETDMLPDMQADSWSAGGMTVWNQDKLNGDTASYSYGELGTVNVVDGYTTFYTATNQYGYMALFADHHYTASGNVTTSTMVSLNSDVVMFEVMLAGNGTIRRNSLDPDTFDLSNQANTYVHYQVRRNDGSIVDGYLTFSASTTGRFRIDPTKELEGVKLEDVDEIIVET